MNHHDSIYPPARHPHFMRRLVGPLALAVGLLFTTSSFAAPAESADKTKPLGKGEVVPDVVVQTAAGKDFSLKKETAGKPTVLIFYRGGWCPFCTKQLAELAKSQQELLDLGYQILAIGADAPELLPATTDKYKLGYTLLSDTKMQASDAFGLAFYLDAATTKRYEERFKLSAKHDGRYWLPVPAVYIVGKDGKIAFVHTDPDYRKRLPIAELLAAAKEAK